MVRIAVTGAAGFLGWHVRCRAFALGIGCTPIGRAELADPRRLAGLLDGVDAVLHCAGVNRGDDSEVSDGNASAAELLAAAVRRLDRPIRTVYANSTQSRNDSVYGAAKRRAGELLAGATPSYSDVVLPNLFGEHGRPHYNSIVATFCHEIAHARSPTLVDDKEVALLHVQDAADALNREASQSRQRSASGHTLVEPAGEGTAVSTVLGLLRDFEAVYRHGELPDITGKFRAALFNTYRSFLFPARYPIATGPRSDQRGTLVECVRTPSSGGQAYVSSTLPGAVRGEHVHLRKFERFLVVAGEAEIALRRLFSKDVVRLRVSGGQPGAIDMPTMWVHNITNVGRTPVTTFFWSNELFNADDPDTYPCVVDSAEAAE